MIVSLIDIYKSDSFFEESEFCRMKKYIEKVKDSSFNKLEEGFDVSHDEGSVDAERYVGMSGNKLMYSKENPKDLFFEEPEEPSEIVTQAFDLGDKTAEPKTRKKINIFEPIMEEEEEYLEDQKHDLEQVHTQAEI